jgi:phosphatidylinositol alpha-1,6-mannosyltransferase
MESVAKLRSERKVLFVSSNFPPVIGGSAVVYDQLCRNADRQIVALGASCDYRTGKEWPEIKKMDAGRGYPIYRVPYLRPPALSQDSPNWIAKILHAVFRDLPIMARVLATVFSLIIKYRVKTVCLGELIYGGWLVFPFRYLLGRTVFIYTHGEEIAQESENLLGRQRGLFLRHASGIIAVSLFCKGQIISKYKIDPKKIHVINNGVDLTAFNPSGQNRDIWPAAIRHCKIILSVSRLVERKGQETLIRALPSILANHPDTHCVIVGGGPMEDRLRELVSELKLDSHCTITGTAPQEDVIAYFRACDLFALPCRTLPDGDTEGFGLVFLEAGACGKPVVAGIAGGTVEAVTDGVTGFLVDGYSTTEVADAINRLLSEPGLAERMGKEGWLRAQDCNWRAVADRFLSVCGTPRTQKQQWSYAGTIKAFPGTDTVRGNPVPNLLITVDVEEEFGWEEFNRERHVVRGAAALRQFHRDCVQIGVSPVYLVTYPILMNPDYGTFLRDVVTHKEAEAGIHLHSWTVPPYWEQANAFTSYQCNLPEHIEVRKLEVLCSAYEQCFQQAVKIHRAGRWGGGERTAALLEKLGIYLDLSPSTGYSDVAAGGPDFTNLDGSPFWTGSVLTIPASSVNYFRGPRWFSSTAFDAARNWPSLRSRAWSAGKPVRFSPENADVPTLLSMARELGLRHLPTAVYTLHSTSLYDGGNPYSNGAGRAELLRARSLQFLSRAIQERLVFPTTCANLFALASANRTNAR